MTRSEIQAMVDAYLDAELKALTGKSYAITNRQLQRQSLEELREGRQEWEQRLADYDMRQRGSSNTYSVADWR